MNSTQMLFDRETTPNVEYVGWAGSSISTDQAQWTIMEITKDSNGDFISIKYAGGTITASNIWDDRASLIYS